MKPRFSLRALLIVVTVAAISVWYHRQVFMQHPVTEKAPESIKPGMTAWEIRWQLGAPHRAGSGPSPTWQYELADGSGCLLIVLDEYRAALVLLEKYAADEMGIEMP